MSPAKNAEQLRPVTFPSDGSHPVQLEGMLHVREGASQWQATVICHPHPLGGGSMHNAVVTAMARSLAASGVVVLRFNFRGVARSGGQHDHGRGEQADLAGAVDWLLAQPQVDPWRLSVAGYSFGAWVGLAHAQADPRVTSVAAVGLPAWHFDAEAFAASRHHALGVDDWQFDPDFLQAFTRPKLFVSGEHDPFAPTHAVRHLVDRLAPPKTLHILDGADHFFQGREREVGRLVSKFIADL